MVYVLVGFDIFDILDFVGVGMGVVLQIGCNLQYQIDVKQLCGDVVLFYLCFVVCLWVDQKCVGDCVDLWQDGGGVEMFGFVGLVVQYQQRDVDDGEYVEQQQ